MVPGDPELRPFGELLAYAIERRTRREPERMTTEIVERQAGRRGARDLELLAIRREDVRGVAILRELPRGRKLRQQIGPEITGRGVHGARGYTMGWLGTASPPMAGTASDRTQGPSATSSGTKASSVTVARDRAASPSARLPGGSPKK